MQDSFEKSYGAKVNKAKIYGLYTGPWRNKIPEFNTLKKSYKRPLHIFSSSSESKIRSIKIHYHMNKPMSNSGSVSFCIPKCVILLTQTKHV